ncbi:MAG: HAD-IB family hydrolase [Actinomycetota bacterium]
MIVAAFDFDGTLTRRDSFVPFLYRYVGPALTTRGLVAAAKARGGRSGRKLAMVSRTIAGRHVDEVAAAGQAYADRLVDRLRPDTRGALENHQSTGHKTVIVTASPELYVGPVGELLGVDAVLGTRFEVDDEGRLTGRYDGRNCRGEEKVRRLDHWIDGREVQLLYAYGDSAGDDALLARADVPTRV